MSEISQSPNKVPSVEDNVRRSILAENTESDDAGREHWPPELNKAVTELEEKGWEFWHDEQIHGNLTAVLRKYNPNGFETCRVTRHKDGIISNTAGKQISVAH
jgi:hypothetical protein